MSDQEETIARNISRLRVERGLTLGELARRSSLSKQTLSTIERGGANPTIGTLAAIATALGTSLRALIVELGTTVLVRRADSADWTAGLGGEVRLLEQVYGSGYVRTSVLRLDARDPRPSEVLSRGSLYHVFVIEGEAEVGPPDRPVLIGPGDFARFPADTEHVIRCRNATAVLHVVTTFPQIPQLAVVRDS